MEAAFSLKVTLWIHDELVYACPEAEAETVKRLIEEGPKAPPWMRELPVTAEVKVKRSGGSAK